MNIKSSQDLVNEANQSIETIDSIKVKLMADNNECILIDVRDIRELWKEGTVKNSKHIPRGMIEFWLDPQSPYFKKDMPITMNKILFCGSNWRSALATKTLMEMGFDNVTHVKGGFQALVDAGFSIQKDEAK